MSLSAPAIVARLRDDLASLEHAYSPGHHGLWSARRRAGLVDTALVALYEAAGAPSEVALVALGGLGHSRQLPRSDLDLMIVHDGGDADQVTALTHSVLYPLWDAGFEVGQAVRTPGECRSIALERLDACTAMLDLRRLAGSHELAESVVGEVRATVCSDLSAFVRRLTEDSAARGERYASATDRSEPDLKEGAGGLRDIDTLHWLQVALGGPLEDAGLLRSSERRALDDAEEFLTRARSALQIETGKRGGRLLREHQLGIAHVMGFQDEPRLIAEDGLMRTVFEHARQVRHIQSQVFERMSGTVSEPTETLANAVDVLRALVGVAEANVTASPSLLDAIEAAELPDPVTWDEATREAFLRLLRAGSPGVEALETLDRLGLFTRYLPAWTDVRCRPQRDPYHRSSVDTHLTGALRVMGQMLAGRFHDDDTVEREAVAVSSDPDALRLGALLHDIGKIGEGGHVAVGTRVAGELLAHMGVEPDMRGFVSFMVEHHLLLPDTATRRDLSDEDLIMDVAARVGSTERLAALYLLAKADAAATGSAAWTPWRQTLIRELVGKVERVLARGEMGTALAERLTERIVAMRDLLSAEPEADVERFVLRMPRGYFLSVEPDQAARHYRTIAPDLGSLEVRTAAVPGSGPGSYELLVVAADRPGLLSWIAGALSLAGLSILSAQVFTTEDGAAVDLFEVVGVFEPLVGERRWREFRSVLQRVIDGRIALDRQVAEKRATYPAQIESPITIGIDNEASDFFTVIEVGAPDRIGLLFDITDTLAQLELDVHIAKVSTYTGRVVDAFYVRDALGRKMAGPGEVASIEGALRVRLDPS